MHTYAVSDASPLLAHDARHVGFFFSSSLSLYGSARAFFLKPLYSVINAITAPKRRRQCQSRSSRVRRTCPRVQKASQTLSISVGNVGRGEGLICFSPVSLRPRGIAVELCSIFDTFRQIPARDRGGNVPERAGFIFMSISLESVRPDILN